MSFLIGENNIIRECQLCLLVKPVIKRNKCDTLLTIGRKASITISFLVSSLKRTRDLTVIFSPREWCRSSTFRSSRKCCFSSPDVIVAIAIWNNFENFVDLIYQEIKPCNFQRLKLRKRRAFGFVFINRKWWLKDKSYMSYVTSSFESKRILGQDCKYTHNRTSALHFTVSSLGAVSHS